MHHFRIVIPEPTDFVHFSNRISQSSHSAFYRPMEGKLGRVMRIGVTPRFVEFGPAPDTTGFWDVTIHDGCSTDETAVEGQLHHLLSLETSLSSFYEHCAHDPRMGELTTRLQGARVLRDADLFSSVVSSIISQQLNLSFAARLKQRLWSLAGEQLLVDDQTFFADPGPEAVARLSYEQLREQQYSLRKAEYVIDFARQVEKGLFDLEALRDMEDEEAMEMLCRVRGMGRWTAECILLFGLGRQDLLPAKDVGLQRAITQVWGLPQRITESGVREMAETWKPWRSWYTYYLWASLAL